MSSWKNEVGIKLVYMMSSLHNEMVGPSDPSERV